MFRNRLRGGHKVGVPGSLVAQPSQPQPNVTHPGGQYGGQYGGGPLQPPLPSSTHTPQPSPQPQNNNNNNNVGGGGGEGSDGAWNWGGGDNAWSWNNNNNNNQQQQKQPYQQPPYSQPHALPPQQSFPPQSKPAESAPAYTAAPAANPVLYPPVPTSQHQPQQPQQPHQDYVNGSSQNGQGASEWGTDNWDDWGSADASNNNKSGTMKPVEYSKPETQQQTNYQQQHPNYQQPATYQQQQQYYQQPQPPQTQEQQQQAQPPQNHEHHNTANQNYSASQPSVPEPKTQPEHPSAQQYTTEPKATEDEWGWENDDWQVNGQNSEQSHQPTVSQGEVSGQVARVTGIVEPGSDGWPNWEENTQEKNANVPATPAGQVDAKSSSEITHQQPSQQVDKGQEAYEQQQRYYQEQQQQQYYQEQQQQQQQQQNYQEQEQQQQQQYPGQQQYKELQQQHQEHQQTQQHYQEQAAKPDKAQEHYSYPLQEHSSQETGHPQAHQEQHYQYQEAQQAQQQQETQQPHQEMLTQAENRDEPQPPQTQEHLAPHSQPQAVHQSYSQDIPQPHPQEHQSYTQEMHQPHPQETPSSQPQDIQTSQASHEPQSHELHQPQPHETHQPQPNENYQPPHQEMSQPQDQHYYHTHQPQQWENNWGQGGFSATEPERSHSITEHSTTAPVPPTTTAEQDHSETPSHIGETEPTATDPSYSTGYEGGQHYSGLSQEPENQPAEPNTIPVSEASAKQESTQPTSFMMDNFDDGWGDGWGEPEAPHTTSEVHNKVPEAENAVTNSELLPEHENRQVDGDNLTIDKVPEEADISATAAANANLNNNQGNEMYSSEGWDDGWDQDIVSEEPHQNISQASHNIEGLTDNISRLDLGSGTHKAEDQIVTQPQKVTVPQSSNYLNQDNVPSEQRDMEISHHTQPGSYHPEDLPGTRTPEATPQLNTQAPPPTQESHMNQYSRPSESPSPREPHPYQSVPVQNPHMYSQLPTQDPHPHPALHTQDPHPHSTIPSQDSHPYPAVPPPQDPPHYPAPHPQDPPHYPAPHPQDPPHYPAPHAQDPTHYPAPHPQDPPHYPDPHPQDPTHYPDPHRQDPHPFPTPPPQEPHVYPTPPLEDVPYEQEAPMATPPMPDPMMSRIPDGASSIPEMTGAIVAPLNTGAESVGSSGGAEGQRLNMTGYTREPLQPPSFSQPPPVSSQPHPQYPARPPSSHTLPDRPASNQSAHSVHSTHSNRPSSNQSAHSTHSNRPASNQSAHSIHSTHSAHSPHLGHAKNQEVPIQEEGEMQVPRAPSGAATSTVDPTAPPSNRSVGPPPVPGPHGTVTNLRARKGSPFQPPPGARSSPSPAPTPPQQMFTPQGDMAAAPINVPPHQDIGANLVSSHPDVSEGHGPQEGVSLLAPNQASLFNVKLAVAAPPSDTHPPMPSKTIPVVVPVMVKEERMSPVNVQQSNSSYPEPPAAHNHPTAVTRPKVQPIPTMPASPSSAALDLSRVPRAPAEPINFGSQGYADTPNFRRMVPGESSKGASGPVAAYQGPAPVPAMPSERVVTGNDNPQPVPLVRVKQEPGEVRSPPDGPATSDLSGVGAAVVPPIRSATIGSEEPKSRTFASGNSGSRSDLTGDQRVGKWERDHSRDRGGGGGYRDRSRDRSGGGRDYYRDDSPHSRRSYDRDDRRRRWRESDDSDISDTDRDRRYYESSRERRDRAYRDELDRYSDRPVVKDDKDRSKDKRRDHRDRSKDYYRSYEEDPYYGRGDRSEPVSRSSSINNLDSEGERSTGHHHHHRSHHRDYYDRTTRDRERDSTYSRDPYYQRAPVAGAAGVAVAAAGWDGRDPRRDPRYYGQRGGYEESYYEQYRLYYQYYRNHPYYKDYYEQMMKQYGHIYGQPSDSSFCGDDRTSIHSGRSSVNDELKKSMSSSQFMQDFHGGRGYDPPSSIYPDGSFSHLKSYPSGEISGVPSVADETCSEVAAPQRLTPVLFRRPHITARFTPGGQLILVPPTDPRDGEGALVQLRDTQKMLQLDPVQARVVQQMKSFPGPLTLSDTHKDVVVRYCEQRASEASRTPALSDRDSVALLWDYLALLVKQNGKLYGSDVAGLLLRGREKGGRTSGRSSGRNSARNSGRTSPQDGQDDPQTDGSLDTGGYEDRVNASPVGQPTPPQRNEEALLNQLTELLCLGRKREAVDYAMREGLWGHALALAFKMDTTTHTRVMAAFSASIPRTDVLHTLFQQLSGKRPEIAKSYTYEQWGDWQRHLAMMVSNPTGQLQRDRASIMTLGDTLLRRGRLHAAHFCYLVAEVVPGTYSQKDSKLVLVGSSHALSFLAFATNEGIQCTEVYEYARGLDTGSTAPALHTFQAYKLIYALRLTECGFPAEALRYCEVIAQSIIKSLGEHKSGFVSQVLDLATRLKYHDLHYQMGEGEVTDMPDPQWLDQLRTALDHARVQDAALEASSIQSNQQDTTPTHPHPQSSTPQQCPPYHNNQEQQQQQPPYHHPQEVQDPYQQQQQQQQPYQNHKGYQGQVAEQTYAGHDTLDNSSGDRSGTNTTLQQDGDGQGGLNSTVPLMQPPPATTTTNTTNNTSGYGGYEGGGVGGYEGGGGGGYWQPNTPYPQQQDTSTSLPPYHHMPTPAHSDTPQPSSLPPSPEMSGEQPPLQGYQPQQPPSYHAWDQMPQPPPPPPQQPQHMDQEPQQLTAEEEAYRAEMTVKKSPNKSAAGDTLGKTEEERKRMEREGGEKGGGFFSSFFGWKKSKQAVLPDDKNPAIVWDEDKKKWVNQDGEEEVSSPPPPPPRSGPPSAMSPSQIPRGGPRKMRYVNTERDSKQGGAPPMMPPMAPLPPGTSPPPQPHPPPASSASPPPYMMPPPHHQQQQQPPPLSPQHPDPTIHQAPPPSQQAPHQSTEGHQGTLSEESSADPGPIPMMSAPPSGAPQFFNPMQFKAPEPTSAKLSSHAGAQSRRGRRGAGYPGKR